MNNQLEGQEKPIFIGASEFNQPSYFSTLNEYGSLFLSNVVLGIDESADETKAETTLKGIIDRQFKELKPVEGIEDTMNTNPGIYVPNKEGELIQVSSFEIGNREKLQNALVMKKDVFWN